MTKQRNILLFVLLFAVPLNPPLLYSQETYHNCGMEGDAKDQIAKDLNLLKNRYAFPTGADMDKSVTLQRMLKSGPDTGRFDKTKAATIQGYVVDVLPGGVESSNCHAKNPRYRDTHIEIVSAPGDSAKIRRVIVEITPRIREVMKGRGIDWSTATLKKTIRHKNVRITGWLFFDEEHVNESENTAPGGAKNWRATAWEVHPITDLQILPK